MTKLNRCPLCGAREGYSVGVGSTYRWRFLNCHACGESITEVRAADPALTGPVPRYDMAWNEAGQHVQSLRSGNFALLEALMGMCSQYLKQADSDHIWHSHMSAGEGAMETLEQAGLIQARDAKYTLDWEALERRREDL